METGSPDIGFVESVFTDHDGVHVISGWTSSRSIQVVLTRKGNVETPLLSLDVRPDRPRTDLPGLSTPGFVVRVGSRLLGMLPADTEIRVSADGVPLRVMAGAPMSLPGRSESDADLVRAIDSGMCWSGKTGDLHMPISSWSNERRSTTLDFLVEAVDASRHALIPTYGTLLGIVRSNSLIPHDNDVDAASFVRADSIDDLADQWVAVIAEVAARTGARPTFADDLFHVMLRREDALIDCWPIWVRSDGTIVDVHSSGPLDDLHLIDGVLEGRRVPILRQTTQFLRHCYGPTFLDPNPSWQPERLWLTDDRYRDAIEFRSRMSQAMVRRVTIAE